jgi:hypothetical protein
MKFYFTLLFFLLTTTSLSRETIILAKPRTAKVSHNHFSVVIGSDYIPGDTTTFQNILTKHNPDLFIWAGVIVDTDESLQSVMGSDIFYHNFKKNTQINAVFNRQNDVHDRYDFIGEPKDTRRRKSSGSYDTFLLKSDYFVIGKYLKVIMIDV